MKLSTSYTALPTDSDEVIFAKEQQALVDLFNQLVISGRIKETFGHDFVNGGFIKKVNFSLEVAEEDDTITVEFTEVDNTPNEPLSGGCTSCAN